MNILIYGTKKCSDSRKAERFFKERRIPFHYRDLQEKGIAKGELDNITRKIPIEDLLDREGKEFSKQQLAYKVFSIEEVLLENALLFRTPIVRNGNECTIGYKPEIWKKWLEMK